MKRLRECEPSSASWSAVDVENEKGYSTPPPPPRRENEKVERKEEPRWTPNGTQVPSGPPPVYEELANYEVEEINRAMRWLGPEPSRVLPRGGDGTAKRPSWLDEEAVRLQRVIEEQARQDSKVWQAPYWSTPASVAWKEHGKDHEAPLSRAYTGQGHEMPLSRAHHGQDQGVPPSRACVVNKFAKCPRAGPLVEVKLAIFMEIDKVNVRGVIMDIMKYTSNINVE